MMRLAIQTAGQSGVRQNAVLDQIASAADRLGHRVTRWWAGKGFRGPCSADMVVMWNGQHNWALLMRRDYPERRFLFAELGWLPQTPCWQLDARGVNAQASWAEDRMPISGKVLAGQPGGDLLVVLQDDKDTQVYTKYLSPMFHNMAEFLRFLAEHADAPIRVRDHPAHPCNEAARAEIEGCDRMKWDESPTLEDALGGAAAMLTINSSCGVSALARGVPVVSFGRSVWTSVNGACYSVFDAEDPAVELVRAVAEITGGANSLNRVAQAAALGRIIGKQWWPEQLPGRLAWALR